MYIHTQAKVQKLEEREQRKQAEACMACGKTAASLKMRRLLNCSACTIGPTYCSTECQKACWKSHKVECKANRKATK